MQERRILGITREESVYQKGSTYVPGQKIGGLMFRVGKNSGAEEITFTINGAGMLFINANTNASFEKSAFQTKPTLKIGYRTLSNSTNMSSIGTGGFMAYQTYTSSASVPYSKMMFVPLGWTMYHNNVQYDVWHSIMFEIFGIYATANTTMSDDWLWFPYEE